MLCRGLLTSREEGSLAGLAEVQPFLVRVLLWGRSAMPHPSLSYFSWSPWRALGTNLLSLCLVLALALWFLSSLKGIFIYPKAPRCYWPTGQQAYQKGGDKLVLPTAEPSLCLNWSALFFLVNPSVHHTCFRGLRKVRWRFTNWKGMGQYFSMVITFLKCKVLLVECVVFTGFPNPRSPHLCWWYAPGLWRKLHWDCHFHGGNVRGDPSQRGGVALEESVS